jgi:sugar lactone lactonase YvrE
MNRSRMLSSFVICAFIVQLITPLATVTAQSSGSQAQSGSAPTTGSLPISFHYVRTFGETGVPYPSAGQADYLNRPGGIILGSSDQVYMIENGGKRLWEMDSSGTDLPGFPIGAAGQSSTFGNPQDVVLHDGNIWVADWNRLVVYSADGSTRQEIYDFNNPNQNDSHWFDCALSLNFDAAGRLFIAQTCGSNDVILMSVSGSLPNVQLTLTAKIGQGGPLNNPRQAVYADLTGHSPALYVSDDNGLQRCSEDGGGNWNCAGIASNFQGRGIGLNPADPAHIYLVHTGWNGQGIFRCDDGGCADDISNPDGGPQLLNDPVDVAFDAGGNAYVTDQGDATIKKFSDPTHYAVIKGTQFIPYVTTDTDYNDPVGVAVAPDNGVLILERQGQRLTRLSDEGAFAWNFGQAGIGGNDYSHINNPEGYPAVDSQGRIYIPDRNNGRVVILSPAGAYLGAIGNQNGENNFQLNSPSGVAIGPNGDIYVSNQDGHNVKIYTADRFYQSTIGDENNNWGSDNAHFNRPSGIAVLDDQTVFVSDMNNQRVQKCTRASAGATSWTCETFAGVTQDGNNTPDHLNQPASLAWDGNARRLYVADQNNNRVQVFAENGDLLASLGGENGQENNQFASPMGVAVDASGALYVADTGNQRVQKFIPVVAPIEFAGQMGGPLQHMVKDGAYLYTSAGPHLDVFSLADPNHPAFVGESDLLPYTMNDLAVQGDYAYVSFENNHGFAILDLTDKTHPVQIGSLPLMNTTSVAVMGSRVYLGAGCCTSGWSAARLFVLDVSQKNAPTILNYLEWGSPNHVDEVRKLLVQGSGNGQTVYAALANQGVSQVDVSSVTASVAPTETARYTPFGDTRVVDLALSADGSLAFAADQAYGVRVFRASAMNDSGLGSYDTRGDGWTPNTISRDGSTLITTAGGSGLGVFDATNPANIPSPTRCNYLGSTDSALGSGTGVVYIARPELGLTTSPLPDCTNAPVDEQTRPGGASGTLLTVGNLTYQASWSGGLRILDTADPAHPRELSVSNLDTSINAVQVLTPTPGTTTYAYLVTGFPGKTGLTVMDVSDPAAPLEAGSFEFDGKPLNTLAVRQVGASIYAFVPESGYFGDPDGGGPLSEQFNTGIMRVLDVTDPSNIQPSGQTGAIFDGQANDILLDNNFALVSVAQVCDRQGNNCVGGGVQVFDIGDTTNPTQVHRIDNFTAQFMDILDGRLYIAAYNQGLIVWDISDPDPNNWQEMGRYRTDSSNIVGVSAEALNGHTYAYISDSNPQNIQLLDVSSPNAIQKIDQSITFPGYTFDVNRIGNYLLVSAVYGGLYTFWVSPEVEAGIPPTGGSLVSDIDRTTVTFQNGDVTRDLRLLHTPILGSNSPDPRAGQVFVGHNFSVSATDASQDRPLTNLSAGKTYDLSIVIDPSGLIGVPENTLGLYSWNGTAWVQEASTIDPGTHTLTAHPNHFSLWSVQGWPSQVLPSGTLTVGSGSFTAAPSVSLALSATGVQSSVAWMRFSNTNNGNDWTEWEAYHTSKAGWALGAGDGTKTVYVQFKDLSGNLSAPISDSIILDTTAPTGSLVIAGSAAYTTTPSVSLSVSVTETNPVEMSFSDDGAAWSAWETFASTKAWSLPGGDGSKTVWARFKDAAGNTSAPYSDAILLDTTAPTGSVIINGGAAVALTTNVLLTLPASDATSGVSQMALSNDGSAWTAWESYTPSRSWTLSAGDGAKTVYARYQDNAGRISANVSANITLDSTPPTGGVTFHNSPAYTNQTSITLDFNTSGAPAQMRYTGQSSQLLAQAWSAFASQASWTLPGGDGVKNVFAQFKNGVGNVSPVYSAGILLDTIAPTGSLLVNGGMGTTASTNVTLVLPTTETGSGVAQMMIANTDTFSGASWETFSATKPWALISGDGVKTVYAKFKDQAGNVSSVYLDTITLDTTAPSGSLTVNGGQPSTTTREVTLTISASGGSGPAESMMLANDASFTGAAWQPFGASLSWSLTDGDGTKTVYIKLRDSAGNISTVYTAQITLTSGSKKIFLPMVKH